MKKHLKILTAFTFLTLSDLCASAEDIELSHMEEARIQSVSGKVIREEQSDIKQTKANLNDEGTTIFIYFCKNAIKQLKNIYYAPALSEYNIQVASSVTSGLILCGLYYSFNTSKP
jgi:hypothetical protein